MIQPHTTPSTLLPALLLSAACAASSPIDIAAPAPHTPDDKEAAARAEPTKIGRQLKAYFERLHQDGRFAGEVLIVRDGDTLYAARHGKLVDLAGDELPKPLQAPIGSITKHHTAALVGRLVDAGQLSLDDTLASLAGIAGPFAKVTVAEILHHQTSIAREPDKQSPDDTSAEQVAACLATAPVKPPAGATGNYSNCAFEILGHAIGAKLNADFPHLMSEWVLKPLALSQTSFDAGGTRPAPLKLKGERFMPQPLEPSASTAAGGLYASVEDLQRFYIGVQDTGFIAEATREGLPAFQSHGGRIAGFMAFAARSPRGGIYILSVADDVPFQTVVPDIMRAAKGEPLPERRWRWTAQPTPADPLGKCTGSYVFPEISDPTLSIALAVGADGPTATIHQNGKETPHRLVFGEDGVLHFVESDEDGGALMPFAVVVETANGDCSNLKIRINAGVPANAQRQTVAP